MPEFTNRHLSKLAWIVALVMGLSLVATDATAAPEGDAERALNLTLSYKKLPGDRRELRAHVTAEHADGELPVEGMLVNFFVGSIGRDGGYGNVTTDANGEAVRILDADVDVPVDAEGNMHFFARSKHPNTPLIQDTVTVKDARIEIATDMVDDKPTVLARVVGLDGGKATPIEATKVDFAIVRSFGNITFGGDFTYTDEEGKVAAEFPEDVPNDASGKLVVLVGLTDHDEYGTVTQTLEVPFGVDPVTGEASTRALWASRAEAPWWLIIVANGALLVIWGSLIYVLRLTYRIRRG